MRRAPGSINSIGKMGGVSPNTLLIQHVFEVSLNHADDKDYGKWFCFVSCKKKKMKKTVQRRACMCGSFTARMQHKECFYRALIRYSRTTSPVVIWECDGFRGGETERNRRIESFPETTIEVGFVFRSIERHVPIMNLSHIRGRV